MDPITGTLATVASLGNIGGSIYAANKQTKAQREANAINREMFEYQRASKPIRSGRATVAR